MKKWIYLLIISLLSLGVIHSADAGSIKPSLQETLQSLGPEDELPVIINLSDKARIDLISDKDKSVLRAKIIKALKDKADVTQGPLKAFLEMRKAKKIERLWIINGIATTVSTQLITEIADLPGVESVTLDSTVSAPVATYGTTASPEWNLSAIGAPELWNLGYTGQGIVIASMDTGVDVNHPDLQSKWRGGTNSWYDPNGQHSAPYDVSGHGTQTMGIMVGGNNGGTSIGMAPGAKWIAVKIFNDSGTATYSVIHSGFQWILDPDHNPATDDAPDVVNNSWGLDNINTCSSEFQPDIQALRASDIAVVFAAGNSGPYSSTSISPANNPGSFAVGATDYLNTIAYVSSRGPSACDGSIYPEVVAPGVNIRTTDLTFGGVIPNSYATVSGTSFAAPHVSGTMALLLGAFPELGVQNLEAALLASAADLGVAGADNAYGYGLINALAAYNYINASAEMPPVAVNDSYSTAEDTILAIGTPGVLGNDTDPNGDPLSAILISTPSNGTLTLSASGSFTYTPKPNFNGTDSFTYKANDGLLDSNVATVRIAVTPVNDAPVAVDDSATTSKNVAVTINVVANDYDVDGTIAPASVSIVTGPRKGIVVNNGNGTVKFTPTKNFRGTDSFTYIVKDNNGATSNTATVTITVK